MSIADFAPEEEPPAAFASGSPSSPEGQRVYRAMEQGSLTPQGAPSATALMAEEALGGPVVQAAGKALKAAPLVGSAAEGLGSMAGRAKELVKGALKGKADEVVEEAATAGVKKADEAADAAKQWQEKGVESPYFKRWFGDSKVVHEDGSPGVVLHGTQSGRFETFKGSPHHPDAFFFTDAPGLAAKYAGVRSKRTYDKAARRIRPGGMTAPEGSATVPVYLRLQDPLVVKATHSRQHVGEVRERALSEAKRLGKDGVIFRGMYDTPQAYDPYGTTANIEDFGDVYVVFSPEQIKSATGNVGTFDPKDPRIAYGVGAGAVAEQVRKDDE
jgi:hypothetical protein